MFLVDQQISHDGPTGIEIIEELALGVRAILVTSYHDTCQIQERSIVAGSKVLPKHLIATCRIKKRDTDGELLDLALIDDSALTRKVWEFSANVKNKNILTYSSKEEFLLNKPHLKTPVFIDYQLANKVDGFSVAKELSQLGYVDLHITTGFEASSLGEKPPWISSVINKEFPG